MYSVRPGLPTAEGMQGERLFYHLACHHPPTPPRPLPGCLNHKALSHRDRHCP